MQAYRPQNLPEKAVNGTFTARFPSFKRQRDCFCFSLTPSWRETVLDNLCSRTKRKSSCFLPHLFAKISTQNPMNEKCRISLVVAESSATNSSVIVSDECGSFLARILWLRPPCPHQGKDDFWTIQENLNERKQNEWRPESAVCGFKRCQGQWTISLKNPIDGQPSGRVSNNSSVVDISWGSIQRRVCPLQGERLLEISRLSLLRLLFLVLLIVFTTVTDDLLLHLDNSDATRS